MASLNQINIIGNVTRDPETRSAGNGTVTQFSVAVNEGAGDRKKTTFFDCDAWDQKAAFVSQYVGKGALVYVSGRVLIEEYTGTDGQKRKSFKIRAYDVQLLHSRDGAAQQQGGYQQQGAPQQYGQQYPQNTQQVVAQVREQFGADIPF
jgi:single-strand DNA-binding protein